MILDDRYQLKILSWKGNEAFYYESKSQFITLL